MLRDDGSVCANKGFCAILAENIPFSTFSRLKVCTTMERDGGRTVRETLLRDIGSVCATMRFLRNIGEEEAFFDFQSTESLRN